MLDIRRIGQQHKGVVGKLSVMGVFALLFLSMLLGIGAPSAHASTSVFSQINSNVNKSSVGSTGVQNSATVSNNASVASMIYAVFGPYAPSAMNVARCESGFNPSAYNPQPVLGSHAMGVFQILYPVTWNTTPEAGASPYDAHANILAAHAIFVRDGYSWREWQCQP